MKMKLAAAAAVTTLLIAGTAAMAQRPAPPTFDSLDTNHDGKLSKEEVNALFERFRRGPAGQQGGAERNGGGARPRRNPDQIFKSWDKNGDGFVSKEEFDSRPRFRGRNGGGRAREGQSNN